MTLQPETIPGPVIDGISNAEFRDFAARFATSPEIGPIRTCLDRDREPHLGARRVVIGLKGCGTLCAAAAFQFYRSKSGDVGETVKLDSVVVDTGLRRRGLAGLLIAESFRQFATDASRGLSTIFAHSVHPATVSLLRKLGFRDPAPRGAPISYLDLKSGADRVFAENCATRVRDKLGQLGLQCSLCRGSDRRARPWCRAD